MDARRPSGPATDRPPVTSNPRPRSVTTGVARSGLLILVIACLGFTWPWQMNHGWPGTSRIPVTPLDHPTLEERVSECGWDPASGYRFALFGDQRALADGEFQLLVDRLAMRSESDERLLFMLDTGDFVHSGRHTDQFDRLRSILRPVRHLPYLVAVGNHELDSNRSQVARHNTAAFLGYLDPELGSNRMYYAKTAGRVRFLFMDTNDLVYGEGGKLRDAGAPKPGSRTEEQLRWLVRELGIETNAPDSATIVVMHHPIVVSSKKYRSSARHLWRTTFEGRTIPDILMDGGVDVVITGHTHTYERFRIERNDGRVMHVVNLSGRPRTSFLWFGDGGRRCQDIRAKEDEWFRDNGWHDMARWSVRQEDAMIGDEANQFAILDVDASDGIEMEIVYLDGERAQGDRRPERVRLK